MVSADSSEDACCLADSDLLKYVSGLFDEESAIAVERHLDQCDTCRDRLPQTLSVAECPEWTELIERCRISATATARWNFSGPLPYQPTDSFPTANRTDAPSGLSDTSAAATGPRLPVRFVPRRRIGAGGMGDVWEVLDTSLGRSVAVKFLKTNTPALQDIQRLLKEASALGRLSHPGIVRIHEVLTQFSPPAIVMEYVRGPSLRKAVRGRAVSDSEAARLMEQIADAVFHAHQQGVVHRDLKPSNVLLQPPQTASPEESSKALPDLTAYRPMISDFGTARLSEEETITLAGQIIGTPAYIAPEQISGLSEGITPAVDIYSMGAMLYELLTGRPPFVTDDPVATLALVRGGDPLRPRLLQPRISPDLENICLKCLALNPGDRYSTALALQLDLQAFLDGRPVAARPISPVIRTVRWIRRNRLLATTLAGLGLSLTGMLAESMYFAATQTRLLGQTAAAERLAVNNAREASDRARLVEYHLNSAVSMIDTLVVQLNPNSPAGDPVSASYRRSLYANVLQLYQDYMTYFCPGDLIPVEHVDEAQRFLWLKNEVDPESVTDQEIQRLRRSLDGLTAEQKQDSEIRDLSVGFQVIVAQKHRRLGEYAAAAQAWTEAAQILRQKADTLPVDHAAVPELLRHRCGILMNASSDYRQCGQQERCQDTDRRTLETLRDLVIGQARDHRDLLNFLITARTLVDDLKHAGQQQEAESIAEDALTLHTRYPIPDPAMQRAANDLLDRIVAARSR